MSFNTIENYPTGELKTEMNIIDGKVEGVVNNYWKNGNLQYTSVYTDGVINGDVNAYDEDGNLIDTQTWVNGSCSSGDHPPIPDPED
jgi:antitoxin component YwqK of YwqJK toxin-antitoxin module